MQVVVEEVMMSGGWVVELVFSSQRDAFCCLVEGGEG